MYKHCNFSKLSDTFFDVKSVSVFGVSTSGHRVEGLSRPEVIPIHSTAVDNGRELSASLSELFSDGRESQNNMKPFSALSDKVVELGISAITLAGFTSTGFDVFADGSLLISREQIRDFTRVQQVVNVF
jgi:hypothetical protein